MVATRSSRKAPEQASTLKAAPKRAATGGKRKAVEDAPAEPAAKSVKTKVTADAKTKKAPVKKVAPAPVAVAPAAPKAVATKAPAARKIAPVKATRPRRTAKTVEEPAPVAKEPVFEDEVQPVEETKITKRTVRGRMPTVTFAAPVPEIKQTVAPIIEPEQSAAVEAPKKSTRGRKPVTTQEAPKNVRMPNPAPVLAATRATRGRAAASAVPVDSPLKKPARRPAARKAVSKAVTKKTGVAVEVAPVPDTPPHIKSPISNEEAMAELPDYPETPRQLMSAYKNRTAFGQLAEEYPKTPGHIMSAYKNQQAMDELPEEYPKTPSHIMLAYGNQQALDQLPDYPQTPAHVMSAYKNQTAFAQLAEEYPKTPGHIMSAYKNQQAMEELPEEYPKTPATVIAAHASRKVLGELPIDYPGTPAPTVAPNTAIGSSQRAGSELPDETPTAPVTPGHVLNQQAMAELPEEYPRTPTTVIDAHANRQVLGELPVEYPRTPAHINDIYVNQRAFSTLPEEYPKTPAHVAEAYANQQAMDELPEYPTTPHIDIEAAVQEALSSRPHTPDLGDISFDIAEPTPTEDTQDELANAKSVEKVASSIGFSSVSFAVPTLAAPSFAAPASPTKRSALRSPMKADLKTPKKCVTWHDSPEVNSTEEEDGPLHGLTFFVDVTSNGKDQSFLFTTLLEDLGAMVVSQFNLHTYLSHVLFKDGKKSTLEHVAASNGKVKCVNIGWVLDSEKNKKRMDESAYLVDMASVKTVSPYQKRAPFTPAKTPTRFLLSLQEQPSSIKSIPSTPTSSEFDRSINFDDKENSEIGIFFQEHAKSVPRPNTSWLNKSPMKTPSKPNFLKQTPMKAFSTTKKRTNTESFGGISMAPPKRLRLV